MENFRKLALYLVLAIIGVFIWQTWQKEHPPASVQQNVVATNDSTNPSADGNGSYVPPTFADKSAGQPKSADHVASHFNGSANTNGKYIFVKTDVLDVQISQKGGDIISASLPKYPVSVAQKNQPIQILTPAKEKIYIAQSGITNADFQNTKFSSAKSEYVLTPSEKQLVVKLQAKTQNGLLVTKTFVFKHNHYVVPVTLTVKNDSSKKWFGSFFYQLIRRNSHESSFLHSRSYNGAAISTPETPYQKHSYKHLNENNISMNVKGGWIAMQQQYFLTTWVPNQQSTNHFYSHVYGDGEDGKGNVFTLGFVSPQVTLVPNASVSDTAQIYVGPEIADRLVKIAKGLDLTIDYGWLWWLSKILFVIMQWIHHVVGNWGWSIVLVTILIKLVFYPLSAKSYRSMARMRDMQPRMQALKERFGDDRQALSKATMELYRKEKINPLGGCLPMIIQIPVFFALYYVLIESVQLRQAPFIFWITDLSVKDPYYVLPILMGVSMFVQQKLSPPPPDPTQAKMMMFLPVIFTVFFFTFPAGLVLYWLVNNCVSVLQQWWIMRNFDPKAPVKKKLRKKK